MVTKEILEDMFAKLKRSGVIPDTLVCNPDEQLKEEDLPPGISVFRNPDCELGKVYMGKREPRRRSKL